MHNALPAVRPRALATGDRLAALGLRALATGRRPVSVAPKPRVLIAAAAVAAAAAAALAGPADARALRAGVASKASTAVSIGGGAVAGKPTRSARLAPGSKARLTRNGLAIPPADAPARVKAAIRAGNRIAKTPYKYGGGHGVLNDSGYDCSGSVSYALRRARLMSSSLASSGFMSWGRRGRGRWITVRANAGHAYMVIAGLRFDTSASKRTGTRWSAQMRSPRGYVATHPPGF